MNGMPYDGRKSDVWALGVCLYILYFKQFPVADDDLDVLARLVRHTPVPFPENTPTRLEELIKGCLNKHAFLRFDIKDVLTSKWFVKNSKIANAVIQNSPDF